MYSSCFDNVRSNGESDGGYIALSFWKFSPSYNQYYTIILIDKEPLIFNVLLTL